MPLNDQSPEFERGLVVIEASQRHKLLYDWAHRNRRCSRLFLHWRLMLQIPSAARRDSYNIRSDVLSKLEDDEELFTADIFSVTKPDVILTGVTSESGVCVCVCVWCPETQGTGHPNKKCRGLYILSEKAVTGAVYLDTCSVPGHVVGIFRADYERTGSKDPPFQNHATSCLLIWYVSSDETSSIKFPRH